MKKISVIVLLLGAALTVFAVPAQRGWQTRTQADGTTIEVQVIGDEFYHYTINRDGQQIRLNQDGMYEVVGAAPSPQQARARHAQNKARRVRQDVGTQPNLAPRGIVVLVDYQDTHMMAQHTTEVFDELCNSTNCTVNKYNGIQYGSAAQYFADQSNGSYRPIFDVYGPIQLPYDYAHYGRDLAGQQQGTDTLASDMVVEACLIADTLYDIDFSQYDSDNDQLVDFVYVIYAGKGQASGGNENTVWPHNWEIYAASYYGMCSYSIWDTEMDGVYLNNYACSNEVTGSELTGIGTLCHEFGHVMGLPDLYDTSYGDIYENWLTPNEWDIMDGGSYNGGGHCPPNYDPWQKQFFGWVTPKNFGSTPQKFTLYANGSADYNVVQINESGQLQGATESGECYYLENRQKMGWDKYVPAAGMVIWRVNFNEEAWMSNAPNHSDTPNAPLYTIVPSSGTRVGSYFGDKNVFPYKAIDSWIEYEEKPVLDITRSGELITATYIGSRIVNWYVDGTLLESHEQECGESLLMPTAEITPCEGTELIGWTSHPDWCDPFVQPDDLFTASDEKTVPYTLTVSFYAVFK